MTNLILVGGGGHCKSTIEVIESQPDLFKITGILDSNLKGSIFKHPVLGDDSCIPKLSKDNKFLITIGSIKSTSVREKVFSEIKKAGGTFSTVIAKSAIVSIRTEIGTGTVIYNRVLINADSKIGKQCIINTASNIEHDCIIGDFVHVSTGAIINGGCRIGNRCFIGSGSVIANGITICDDVITGAGTVVIHDITEPGTYVGNPARKIK